MMNHKLKLYASVMAKTGHLGAYSKAVIVRVDTLICNEVYHKYSSVGMASIKPGTYGVQFGNKIDSSPTSCNFWAYFHNVKLIDDES